MHYTVVIAGGGPAGSAAAYTLARQGIQVCLIDKAIFPREKLCGGLLTLRSKKIFHEIFDADWDKAYNFKTGGIHFLTRDGYLNGTEQYRDFYFTHRLSFDDYLLGLARDAGATIKEGEGLFCLSPEKNSCALRSGEELTYDYLIGADGVNSVVAKTLFGESFRKEKITFALELDVDKVDVKRDVLYPEIYFDCMKWGYGWVFPKADSLTVGVGGLLRLNPDMKSDMARFCTEITGKAYPGKVKGHYIPGGDYRKKPGRENILLAGDAAGFVEPVSGEGIAYAMQSGYLAAQAVFECIKTGNPKTALGIYRKKSRVITRDIQTAKLLRVLLFSPLLHKWFIRVLPKTHSLVHKHIELLSDEISYTDYTRFIFYKAGEALFRKVFGKRKTA